VLHPSHNFSLRAIKQSLYLHHQSIRIWKIGMRKIRVFQVFILLFCLIQTGSANSTSSSGQFTFNTSIDPGDDLFSYVNDGWVAEHPLPANKSSYTTFTAVNERTDDQLHTLFDTEASDYASGKESLIGKFYTSGMDNKTIDNLSISPLSDEIARISSISTRPVQCLVTSDREWCRTVLFVLC